MEEWHFMEISNLLGKEDAKVINVMIMPWCAALSIICH